MPPTIKGIYATIQQEVQHLHREWLMFRQVFGTSPERIALISRVADAFFGVTQRALYHEVLLSLFRLADPPDHGKNRPNLVLERLVNVVKTDDAPLAGKVYVHLIQIRSLLGPHVDLRNKVIAHNDLTTTPTLYDGTATVCGPSRGTIEDCLQHLRDALNLVSLHYDDAEVMYWNASFPPLGDGEALIRHLQLVAQVEG
jgi:hypothetical protein